MSDGKPIPIDHARKLVNEVIDLLRPGCQRIEIAGSVRREKQTVHDLEIVAQPHGDTLTLADELQMGGTFIKRPKPGWGQRLKAGIYAGQNVDIFISLPDRQWACTYWLRTGGAEANHLMVTQKYRGGILPDDLVFCSEQFWKLPASLATFKTEEVERCKKRGDFAPLGGEIIPTPDEADVFALAGLPFIPPRYRDERTYRALAGRRLVAFGDVAHLWDKERQVWALPELAYIGRAMPNHGLPASPWGNPFKLTKDTPEERTRGVAQYRTHIADVLAKGGAKLDDLHGKTLVCWCKSIEKPDTICHGDVLLELLGQSAPDAAPQQAKLFGAEQMREMKFRAAVIAEERSAPKATKPTEPFVWRRPWLDATGLVWVHWGSGEWRLCEPTHERARLYFERLASLDYEGLRAQSWLLEAFLMHERLERTR